MRGGTLLGRMTVEGRQRETYSMGNVNKEGRKRSLRIDRGEAGKGMEM